MPENKPQNIHVGNSLFYFLDNETCLKTASINGPLSLNVLPFFILKNQVKYNYDDVVEMKSNSLNLKRFYWRKWLKCEKYSCFINDKSNMNPNFVYDFLWGLHM